MGLRLGQTFLLLALVLASSGCPRPYWMRRETCVLDPGVSKTELVAYLNKNILGDATHGGLASWSTSDARASITGVPMSLPTSIAVVAPRAFRLRVSHPVSGGQEADIGSNDDRFWMWSKDMPQIMTASHQDVGLALDYLNLPVPIRPDWLMDVFGVIPLDEAEYQLVRTDPGSPVVDLVCERVSPQGDVLQRVIRVNTCRGQITEQLLRRPDGHLIARAVLENYRLHEGGVNMPGLVRLQWPDAHVEMRLDLGHPQLNPPALTENEGLWQVPHIPNVTVVDIGEIARRKAGVSEQILQTRGEEFQRTGSVELPSSNGRDPFPEAAASDPWNPRDQGFSSPVPTRSAANDPLDAPRPDPAAVFDNSAAPPWAR